MRNNKNSFYNFGRPCNKSMPPYVNLVCDIKKNKLAEESIKRIYIYIYHYMLYISQYGISYI